MRWQTILKHVALYANEVQKKFIEISDDIRFQHMFFASYRNTGFKVAESTWNDMQKVSVNSNDEVIGYFAYDIDRDCDVVYNLEIVNFTLEPSLMFSKDLSRFLRNAFDKYKHRKLKFSCTADNPVLSSYKRLCWRYGGRIVGIYEQEKKLLDGDYHDVYNFEIMRDNYLKKKLSRCKHEQAYPLH